MARVLRGSPQTTVSAGGVVVNQEGMVLVVNQRGTTWSLPKGHIDPGEDPLHAAIREIKEESGIVHLQYVRSLGSYGRYKLGLKNQEDKKEWKILVFFLFKTRRLRLKPLDPHNPQAIWVHPDKVAGLLTHPKDKAFYQSILSQIQ